MKRTDKPLAWLRGEIKTPPFSPAARLEAGLLLRKLLQGETLSMPHSRPLKVLGARCHELRVKDADHEWRIIYRIDPDVILVLEVFRKKTGKLPGAVVESCVKRQKMYDQ